MSNYIRFAEESYAEACEIQRGGYAAARAYALKVHGNQYPNWSWAKRSTYLAVIERAAREYLFAAQTIVLSGRGATYVQLIEPRRPGERLVKILMGASLHLGGRVGYVPLYEVE